MQVEDGKSEGSEKEEFHKRLQAYSSIGEVSFLCNTPQNYTVLVRELCRVLRLDKHSFTDILKTYYLDGQIILNNFNVVRTHFFCFLAPNPLNHQPHHSMHSGYDETFSFYYLSYLSGKRFQYQEEAFGIRYCNSYQ